MMKYLKTFENFDGVLTYDNGSNARTYRYNNANPAIELEDNGVDVEKNPNYMVIQNLKTIVSNANDILDNLEEDLEDWAKDHISTSKDDIEEVANFLKFGE